MAVWLPMAWAILVALQECGCWRVTSPDFELRAPSREKMSVTFGADAALTACQVRELNRAQPMRAQPDAEGRCVAEVRGATHAETHFVFAWRAHAQAHGHRGDDAWHFALAVVAVMGESWRVLNASVATSNASVRVQTEVPLRMCKYRSVDAPAWQRLPPGNCTVDLRDVTSGLVLVQARTDDAIFLHAHAHVHPEPPEASSLSLALARDEAAYEDGEYALASCKVGPARPPARISWTLDDAEIAPEDLQVLDEADADEWHVPWEPRAHAQRVLVRLSVAHNGSEIACLAHHATLANSGVLRTARRVSVSPRAHQVVWPLAAGGAAIGLLVVVATALAAFLVWRRRRSAHAEVEVTAADAGVELEARQSAIYEDIDFALRDNDNGDADSDIYDDVDLAPSEGRYARAQSGHGQGHGHRANRSSAPALPPKRR